MDAGEAFRMARHQDQQRVGTRFQQAPVGCQDDLVLAGMGAGGDPQRSRRRVPFLAQGGSGQRQRVDAQVELDRAGHADALRTRAETTEALGLGLGLHGDPGQLGEHRPGQPGEARVATRRALGQARIGQRHRDPRTAQAWIWLGHSSVSMITARRGRTRSRKRAAAQGRS